MANNTANSGRGGGNFVLLSNETNYLKSGVKVNEESVAVTTSSKMSNLGSNLNSSGVSEFTPMS